MSYAFMMRDELPADSATIHPELPAAVRYLQPFDEKIFGSREEFVQLLQDYAGGQYCLNLADNNQVRLEAAHSLRKYALGALEEILRK